LASPVDVDNEAQDEDEIRQSDSFNELAEQAHRIALQVIDEIDVPLPTTKTLVPFATPSYPNEIESRTVLVSNLDPQTRPQQFFAAVSRFGEVECLSTENISRGVASVKFYDLRSAYRLRGSSHSVLGGNRGCAFAFGPTDSGSDEGEGSQNKGTIIVSNIGNGVSDEVVVSVFGVSGQIREVRRSPGKESRRFVEFWDKRSAARCVSEMNGRFVDDFQRTISVDFSRPGGFRARVLALPGNHLPTVERCSREMRVPLFDAWVEGRERVAVRKY
jgi:RNA recognition motif-containing protein